MKITTKGMKGHDRTIDLGRLTYLTAPVGTGKSTIADALRLGVLGFIPHLGKSLPAKVMPGRELEVVIELDDGRTFKRLIRKTDSGGLKGTVNASWVKAGAKGNLAEHDAAILQIFGKEVADVAECLDIRSLLDAGPTQRAARVEPLVSPPDAPIDEQLNAIGKIMVQRLLEIPEDAMPAQWDKLQESLSQEQATEIANLMPVLIAKLEDAKVAGATTWVNGEKRESEKGLRAKRLAATEIRERVEGLPKTGSGELERLQAEGSALEREIGAFDERTERIAEHTQDLEAARFAVSDCRGVVKTRQSEVGPQPKAGDLERARQACDDRTAPDREQYYAAIAEKRSAYDALRARVDALLVPESLTADVETKEEVLKAAQTELQLYNVQSGPFLDVRTSAHAIETLVTTKSAKDVKIKGHVTTLLNSLSMLPQPTEEEEARLRGEVDSAGRAYRKADKANDERALAIKQAKATRDKLNLEAEELHKELVPLEEQADQKFGAAKIKYAVEHRALIERRDELQTEKDAYAEGQASLKAAVTALEGAEARLAAKFAEEAPEALDTEGDLAERLTKTNARIQTLTAAEGTRQELEKVASELDALEVRAEVLRAMEEALKQLRAAEISAAGGPLLTCMTKFFEAAGLDVRPYIKAESGSFEIGWKDAEGVAVDSTVLSGGEWCIFTAAFTCGVLAQRGGEERPLLVEAGEIADDEYMLHALLLGIEGMMTGRKPAITRALVMTPHLPPAQAWGWSIVRFPREAREQAA